MHNIIFSETARFFLMKFPLFQSHLDLAHSYWERLLQNGDWAIDATCGAGNDTLRLAGLQGIGGVIGIDIQEEAIVRTGELLRSHLSAEALSKVYLFQQSHANFPEITKQVSVKLVVFNLGYLPKGNKQLTTMAQTTLQSAQKALELITLGGAVSITCYPGHPEGAVEQRALIEMLTNLSPFMWNVCFHSFPNRAAAPSLILIQKKTSQE